MSDLYNTEETENTSASLIDDFQLDEMQKAENYKIGFQMFKVLFYIVMFISYAMFIISSGRNTAMMVLSFVLYACGWTVYIIYAAMASAKGVMNPTFVRNNTKNWQIFVYVCFMLLSVIFALCDIFNVYQTVIWSFTMIMLITVNCFVKRNMSVLKKQLEEDGE